MEANITRQEAEREAALDLIDWATEFAPELADGPLDEIASARHAVESARIRSTWINRYPDAEEPF